MSSVRSEYIIKNKSREWDKKIFSMNLKCKKKNWLMSPTRENHKKLTYVANSWPLKMKQWVTIKSVGDALLKCAHKLLDFFFCLIDIYVNDKSLIWIKKFSSIIRCDGALSIIYELWELIRKSVAQLRRSWKCKISHIESFYSSQPVLLLNLLSFRSLSYVGNHFFIACKLYIKLDLYSLGRLDKFQWFIIFMMIFKQICCSAIYLEHFHHHHDEFLILHKLSFNKSEELHNDSRVLLLTHINLHLQIYCSSIRNKRSVISASASAVRTDLNLL